MDHATPSDADYTTSTNPERPVTVSKLLEQLNVDPRRVAVEHNLVVLKRTAYDSTLVKEGDEVEVVNFVGGGTLTFDP